MAYDEYGRWYPDRPWEPDQPNTDPDSTTGVWTPLPSAPTTEEQGGTPEPDALAYNGQMDPYAWIQQQAGSLPASTASLQRLIDALIAGGANVQWATNPTTGAQSRDVVLINGTPYDLLNDVDGNASWQFAGPHQAGAGGEATGVDPSYLEPFTQSFTDFYNQLYGGSDPAALQPFAGPGAFQQPTAQDILQDPSYQFRLDQGRGMYENSAAARGTLNSGGSLYDLLNLGQNMASQEYGNVWNRRFQNWQQDWGNALAAFGMQQGTSDTAFNRAWQQYRGMEDTFRANQDNPFAKLAQMSQLGVNAAGA